MRSRVDARQRQRDLAEHGRRERQDLGQVVVERMRRARRTRRASRVSRAWRFWRRIRVSSMWTIDAIAAALAPNIAATVNATSSSRPEPDRAPEDRRGRDRPSDRDHRRLAVRRRHHQDEHREEPLVALDAPAAMPAKPAPVCVSAWCASDTVHGHDPVRQPPAQAGDQATPTSSATAGATAHHRIGVGARQQQHRGAEQHDRRRAGGRGPIEVVLLPPHHPHRSAIGAWAGGVDRGSSVVANSASALVGLAGLRLPGLRRSSPPEQRRRSALRPSSPSSGRASPGASRRRRARGRCGSAFQSAGSNPMTASAHARRPERAPSRSARGSRRAGGGASATSGSAPEAAIAASSSEARRSKAPAGRHSIGGEHQVHLRLAQHVDAEVGVHPFACRQHLGRHDGSVARRRCRPRVAG